MKKRSYFADTLRRIIISLCATSLALSCVSCTNGDRAATPSKTVGVSRAADLVIADATRNEIVPNGITNVIDEQPPLDDGSGSSSGNTDPSASVSTGATGAVSWKYENGHYTYSFPEPDRSTLSDLTDINSTSRAFFADVDAEKDKSGSWYFGRTVYDETTGEVDYVWDRYPETLALLERYGGIYRGDTTRKVCYLTFDCGYENGNTDKIMDTLKAKGVSGTFFITGAYIDSSKEQVKRMLDEGHIVGNHTNNHPNMALATAEDFIDEIVTLEEKVKAAFPDSPPIRYYRPPEGATSEWALKLADKMGIKTVLWSYTYKDFDPDDQADYATALGNLKSGLHPGCVYLMHAISSTNAAVLGELIDWIRSQGYEILPLCDIDTVN